MMTDLKVVATGFVLLTLSVLVFCAPVDKPRIKRWIIMGIGTVPGIAAVVTGFILFVTDPNPKLAWAFFSSGLILGSGANPLYSRLSEPSACQLREPNLTER